jgi:hypothetical protein
MSVQVGAHYLEKEQGGRGVLLGGVPGVAPAKVAILGGGVAGVNAAQMATGMRADVTIYDINNDRLAELDMFFSSQIKTAFASRAAIANAVEEAELVIGAVLVPGAAAPKLVTRDMLKTMKRGSVLVDIAIDQGGCFETSHADDPRRPGLRGRRHHPLLRRQHARRGGADQRLRAQQCDPAVRAQDRQPRRRGGDAAGPAPRQRAQRLGRQDPPPGGRRSARPAGLRARRGHCPAAASLSAPAGAGEDFISTDSPSSTSGRQLASAGALARISRHRAKRPSRSPERASARPRKNGGAGWPGASSAARAIGERAAGVSVPAWSTSALPSPTHIAHNRRDARAPLEQDPDRVLGLAARASAVGHRQPACRRRELPIKAWRAAVSGTGGGAVRRRARRCRRAGPALQRIARRAEHQRRRGSVSIGPRSRAATAAPSVERDQSQARISKPIMAAPPDGSAAEQPRAASSKASGASHSGQVSGSTGGRS